MNQTSVDRRPHQPFASVAVGRLRDITIDERIVTYLEEIDATLQPFGGRFVLHGGEEEVVEGAADEAIVVIGFPERDGARRWYDSPAYQRLARLRQSFAGGVVSLHLAEDDDHLATDILDAVAPGRPA